MCDVFHQLPVSHDLDDGKVRSRDVIVDSQVKFSTLLLEPEIRDGLAKCGYIYLSPIQQNALPLALTGSSIIAHAKSGTGKTLIYVLPILNDFVKRKLNDLRCLVLAPTREIAKQIYDVFQNVACNVKGLQVEYFIGGTPLDMDVIKCMNCNLAIGAPGRIKHLIELGYLKTANLEFLVLDEVDALFDHKEYEVEHIISTLPPPKQLIVCSATFSSKVGDLVKSVVPSVKYTTADSVEIEEISNVSNMLVAIKQYVAPVKKDSTSMGAFRKREKLVDILKKFKFEQCFIFVNYMTLVRSICNYLISENFPAVWICSDQDQSTRINTIHKLKMNRCKILVTTDLAARGIDVHKVNLVINVGLPCPPEIYIHRMGRAGRYGSEGAVITILSEGEEMATFTKMMSVVSTDPIDLHVLPDQIDATLSNLEVIRCLPTEGSISVDEFSFKCHMKDNQEKVAVKKVKTKKSKKKKRKGVDVSKLALQNNTIDQLSAVHKSNVEMANPEVNYEMVNACVEQFSQSLADYLVAGELAPDWNSLKYLFGLEDDHTTTDESFAFIENPPAKLLTYARHIKRRNELIDEQIMPCSVDEFLSLLNHRGSVFGHHSPGLSSLIKEIAAKIERPAKQQLSISRSVTASDISSVDSEQSEISSQVSSIGVTSLSQRLLATMINDSNEKTTFGRKVGEKNAYSSSKRFSGSFSLAEDFSNAMMNYGKDECSSSPKQSASINTPKQLPQSDSQNTVEKFEVMSPKQFFSNYKRLNSDVENTALEVGQPKRVCSELESLHQSTNAPQDSVTVNTSSQSTVEEGKISPNRSPRNCRLSHEPSNIEKQPPKNFDDVRIRADKADGTSSLSGELLLAVKSGPHGSSQVTRASPTGFSISHDHSKSIFTHGQLDRVKDETNIKSKHRDFNLSDQFLSAIGNSLTEANSQNPLKESEISLKWSPGNLKRSDKFSSRSPPRKEISKKRVPTDYSSGNISLSSQFSASVNRSGYNRESTFGDQRQSKSSILGASKNKLDADGLAHDLICKTDTYSVKTPPKVADQKTSAVPRRHAENVSKSVTGNRSLSNQFLNAFGRGEPPEMTFNRSAAVARSSSNFSPASIPNIEKVSGRSLNLVSEVKKSASHLTSEVKSKPESSLKSVLVPTSGKKSNISTVLEMNDVCSSISTMKNPNNLSSRDEANKESSLFVSNFKQKLNFEVPSDLKSYRIAADCRMVGDETFAEDATNAMRKPRFENVSRSKNAKPSHNRVPIPSKQMMSASKVLDTDTTCDRLNSLCGDQTVVNLPSLRSHVSSHREQKIWQHHFAFIRQAVLRGRVGTSQY